MKNNIVNKLYRQYQAALISKEGDTVIKDLSKRYHIDTTSYKSGESAYDLAYREGQRSVVLYILGILKKDLSELDK